MGGNDNVETFADGVPREGISRQHVLTRIGVMSLIRKKNQEFEAINGRSSMPHMSEKLKNEGKLLMTESEQTTATNTPQSGTPASSARASPAPKEEVKPEKLDEKNDNKDESKEKQSTIEEKKPANEKDSNGEVKEKIVEKDADKEKDNTDAKTKEVSKDSTESKEISKNDLKEEDKENKEDNNAISKDEDSGSKQPPKFMFNIADGGFTELHTLWQNEERAAVPGREYEIWHRRHDY